MTIVVPTTEATPG